MYRVYFDYIYTHIALLSRPASLRRLNDTQAKMQMETAALMVPRRHARLLSIARRGLRIQACKCRLMDPVPSHRRISPLSTDHGREGRVG